MKILIFLIVGLMTIGAGWYYRDALQVVVSTIISPYQPVIQKISPKVTPKPTPPSDWENINVRSVGLVLKVPPGWVFEEATAKLKPPSGKSFITLSSNSGILVPSIFNQDLFNKISGLKTGDEFTEENFGNKIKFRKIESGKILSGQPYTLFLWEYSTQMGGTASEIRAFILKDTTLIIFILSRPTDENIEVLKKIASFSSLI